MNRIFGETLAGVLMIALSVAAGLAVMVVGVSRPSILLVPVPIWAAGFTVLAVLLCLGTFGMDDLPRGGLRSVLIGIGMLVPALVASAPGASWFPLATVVAVSIAAYVLGPSALLTMILANTGAIIVGHLFLGMPARVSVLVVVFFAIGQVSSVASVRAHRRAEAMSRSLTIAHAELAARNAELQAAAALLADSERADERLRISRDLHDVSGHQLTALALELELAAQGPEAQVGERVRRARALAGELLGDIRATVGELRRDDLDVTAALEQMTSDLPTLEVHLAIDPELRLDPELGRTLVRCAQEAITNTIRHAGAKNLWLSLRRDAAGFVELEARDDGSGAARVDEGHGLTGMAERLRAHDGELSLSGDEGFRVLARVPG